eukprot:1192119-Prorocentrum_minimum.AAC.1
MLVIGGFGGRIFRSSGRSKITRCAAGGHGQCGRTRGFGRGSCPGTWPRTPVTALMMEEQEVVANKVEELKASQQMIEEME